MKAKLPENQDSIQKYRFLYHFVPQDYDKKRARLLSHGALMAYTLILSFTLVIFKFVPGLAPGILGYASNINSSDLLKYTNERRAKIGLSALKINPTLAVAAQKKAEDMFSVGYWSHVSPRGTEPWDFILNAGYDYIYAGENLAKNFSNSKEVVQAWYDSPTHRDNLLSSNYDEIGFAVVNGVLDGYETTIVVQMFGKTRKPVQVASSGPAGVSTAGNNSLGAEDTVNIVPEPVVAGENLEVAISEPVVEKPTMAKPAGEEQASPAHSLIRDQGDDNTSMVELPRTKLAPLIDVRTASTSLTFLFGGFITSLLGLDIWYSKKHNVLKFTGHTAAHLTFLLVILVGIMISIIPGVIL